MKRIFKHTEIGDDQTIYLRKDFLGWRVVDPILDTEGNAISNLKDLLKIKRDAKNIAKFVFGGKRVIFYMILGILGYTLVYLGIHDLIDAYKQVMSNPCAFCESCQNQCREVLNNVQVNSGRFKLNLTGLNITQ